MLMNAAVNSTDTNCTDYTSVSLYAHTCGFIISQIFTHANTYPYKHIYLVDIVIIIIIIIIIFYFF